MAFMKKRVLTVPVKKTSGRNNTGCITAHHIGGGFKRRVRVIGMPFGIAEVQKIEYTPTRSAPLALVCAAGIYYYVLAYAGIQVGDKIEHGYRNINIGNRVTLQDVPLGMSIYGICITPFDECTMQHCLVCTAGTSAKILSKDGKEAVLKLPSKNQIRLDLNCFCTIGVVANSFKFRSSAGRSRRCGIRPTVRKNAKNAIDR